MADLGRLRVLESALGHGLADDDVLRAVHSPLRVIADVPRAGVVTLVGFDTRGLAIEVMIDLESGGHPAVFHARPISESRQRELLGERR